jgi:hypothetical protein
LEEALCTYCDEYCIVKKLWEHYWSHYWNYCWLVVTCTIEGNNFVGSLLKPLLKKVTPLVGLRMLWWFQENANYFECCSWKLKWILPIVHTLYSSFYLVRFTLNRYSYIIWDNCIWCCLLDFRKPHYYVVPTKKFVDNSNSIHGQ